MKKRIISGIIIALILIPTILIGGVVFDVVFSLMAPIALLELLNANKKVYIPKIIKLISVVLVLVLTLSNIDVNTLVFGLSYQLLGIIFITLFIPTLFLKKYKYDFAASAYTIFSCLFIGTIFNLFIMLFQSSKLVFIYLLLISCITDIFALFGGKLIGKHKFSKISPNKTIEGCIVGSTMAVIIASTYYYLAISNGNLLVIMFITLILSIIGQIGDLFFSFIKRENDMKDFSNLIPGHGGILDRIDNIIFVCIAYIIIAGI